MFSPLFGEDIYAEADMHACMARRRSVGGTAPESVKEQIRAAEERLKNA